MNKFNGTHACSLMFGKTFMKGKGGEGRGLVSKEKKKNSYIICNVGILCCRLDLQTDLINSRGRECRGGRPCCCRNVGGRLLAECW